MKVTTLVNSGMVAIAVSSSLAGTADLDSTFRPPEFTRNGGPASLHTVKITRAGQILIAGNFDRVGTLLRNRVALLNADGSVDPSLNLNLPDAVQVFDADLIDRALPGGGYYRSVAVAGGPFTCLNESGNVAVFSFTGEGCPVYQMTGLSAVTALSDGRVAAGGSGGAWIQNIGTVAFPGAVYVVLDDFVGGQTGWNIGGWTSAGQLSSGQSVRAAVRHPSGAHFVASETTVFRANGRSIDNTFNPVITGGPTGSARITSMAVQRDGKILLGGSFDQIGGQPRNRIARITSGGALDLEFDAGLGDGAVSEIALQEDGKVLLAGGFSTVKGQLVHRNLIRLSNDAPPIITDQPRSQAVVFGGVAILTVGATAPGPLSYEWRHNGITVGETSVPYHRVENVQGGDEGAYNVVIRGPVSSVESETVQLSVRNAYRRHNLRTDGSPRITSVIETDQDLIFQVDGRPGGNVRFRLSGEVGQWIDVQRSPNPFGTVNFTISKPAAFDRRFFHVIEE